MKEAAEEWLFRLMKRSQTDREKSYISPFHTPEYLASTSRFGVTVERCGTFRRNTKLVSGAASPVAGGREVWSDSIGWRIEDEASSRAYRCGSSGNTT